MPVYADNLEEAEERAWKELDCSVCLCHQCSPEAEDAEIHELFLEARDDD